MLKKTEMVTLGTYPHFSTRAKESKMQQPPEAGHHSLTPALQSASTRMLFLISSVTTPFYGVIDLRGYDFKI